ncbi:Tetraspanin-33 [Armadillidium nasatum]|uniref:Tetraspanin n=1 Tax=Armadillidium nasatum TaxID=96803 RepID=A0A5N5TA83_9CRUS|nr:Tetraspanin-33 [Armadillidium nasatum]
MAHRRHRRKEYISPCLKWTMFIFNFIFWMFGLLIMAIGTYGMYFTAVDLQDKKSLELLYIIFTDLSGVMLAVGGVIFLISSAGCVGALRENMCLLKFYFWSLTIFLILELMIAIACIVFPWKSREFIEGLLSQRLIEEYRESENTQDMVDFLQSKMECCGMTGAGYKDWNHNEYFNCTESSPSVEKCGVPPSCCINYEVIDRNMMCGYDMQKKKETVAADTIYTRGCFIAAIQILESNLYIAAGVIFGITLFQMYVTHQARTLMDQISLQKHRN